MTDDYRQLNIEELPEELGQEVSRALTEFSHAAGNREIIEDADTGLKLPLVWACSRFVANYACQKPEQFTELLASGDLLRNYPAREYGERVEQALSRADDEESLKQCLRQLRNREMVRIAWRDIARLADLERTMSDLSLLAEAILDCTLSWLQERLEQIHGTPCDAEGVRQSMIIVAMGKLGAHELNFSSDIDLVFSYGEAGETSGGRKPLSNQEFFTRLSRKLISALNDITADGFVFRVDMRLRPFGDSGPVVSSIPAMETYYATSARDWERYAMIKANIAAGDRDAGDRLVALLKPFIYRRYLDYGAFESLREMKAMIDKEVERKGIQSNVKLGPGGIREIEFIGQTFQLIRGGHDPLLQGRRILEILQYIKLLGYLPEYAVDELTSAYIFLRNTEHRLQEVSDIQTQELPDDSLERQRLALGMGFQGWQIFEKELNSHRDRVRQHFDRLFEDPHNGQDAEATEGRGVQSAWQFMPDRETVVSVLSSTGFEDAPSAFASLARLDESRSGRYLSKQANARLDRLMPLLLSRVAQSDNPAVTLERMLELVATCLRRSVYLSLLSEHPLALSQLVRLVSASPWIADQIIQQPILLDELLDPRSLYSPPGYEELQKQIESLFSRIPEDDLEKRMESLRQFKNAQVLRVAAADIVGSLPVAEVSNHLSAIAEVVLQSALDQAWSDLTAKHGEPGCLDQDVKRVPAFAIIAYGKLGGLELGYSSDLDLVFLHDSRGSQQHADGPRAIDNNTFFTRLAQRIIHFLTTVTPAGIAYEVDMRLRPNGASGLLVSSLDAFTDYQQRNAWTWEHQALIRARPVAGEPGLRQKFNQTRRAILGKKRDPELLKSEINKMRERMRKELCNPDQDRFDLKQGPGGITDIEFMVQYAVLRWAPDHPALLDVTDNLRLLEAFAQSGLMAPHDCNSLHDAYFAYRAAAHRLALQQQPALASNSEFVQYRSSVIEIWNKMIKEKQE